MPLSRPTLKELSAQLRDDLARELRLNSPFPRTSILTALTYSLSGALHLIYGRVDSIRRQLYIDSATGQHLDRLAFMLANRRHPKTAAQGAIKLTGKAGIIISKSSTLTNKEGDIYTISEDGAIDEGGILYARVVASRLGPDGNLSKDEVLILNKPIAGVDKTAVSLKPGIIDGFAEESDELLRARLKRIIAHTGQGGSKNDYIRWAQSVPGVGKVLVDSQEDEKLTIRLNFLTVDPGSPIPSDSLVKKVQLHINERKPLGTRVIVSEGDPKCII